MKFLPTKLPEVILVTSDVYRDARGVFLETYHAQKYREGGISPNLCRITFLVRSVERFVDFMLN